MSREALESWRDQRLKVSVSYSFTPRARTHHTHTHTHVYVVLLSCNIGLLLCSDFSIILCALLSRLSSQRQSNVCLLLQRRQNAFSSSPLPASACPGGRDAPLASPQTEAASPSPSLLQGHLSAPSWFSLQGLLMVGPVVMMGDWGTQTQWPFSKVLEVMLLFLRLFEELGRNLVPPGWAQMYRNCGNHRSPWWHHLPGGQLGKIQLAQTIPWFQAFPLLPLGKVKAHGPPLMDFKIP